VDVPRRPRLLRRVRDLGPGRPAPHLRSPGLLQRAQLVLPRRPYRPGIGVAPRQGAACSRVVDRAHQPAGGPRRHGEHAAGVHAQLHGVDLRGHGVQLRLVPVPQGVVAEVQLRAVGRHGRRRGHHGGAPLLRAGGTEARLVGNWRRVLRPRNLPNGQGRAGARVPRPLNKDVG
jgi:hypothetical protein